MRIEALPGEVLGRASLCVFSLTLTLCCKVKDIGVCVAGSFASTLEGLPPLST